MLRRNTSTSKHSWFGRYAIAVGAIAVAVMLRLPLRSFMNPEAPFLLLFAAVLVASAFGGLGPGLLATLLGAGTSNFVVMLPNINMDWSMDKGDIVRTFLFLCEGIFISVLGARLQAARRRAEQSEAEARQLEQKILDVSDAERRRIGQDLHDGLGQHLTGVAFLSKALQQRLAAKSIPEAADAIKIVTLVSESIGQTRALAKGLAPVGLEDSGLPGALTQLAAATSGVFKIDCSFHADDRIETLELPVATHLYRVAQEAVNNAIRHGKASRIRILLDVDDDRIRLSVEDNGIGISPSSDQGGMGLQIMSFRARMIGGNLQVLPRDVGGTVVICSAPASPGAHS
jgi:signal transduction histidine kinase